jgi:hypothetical protein
MKFLKDYTIQLNDVPEYEEFKTGYFKEMVDKKICNKIVDKNEFDESVISRLKEYTNKIKNDTQKIKYYQSCNMGRFYGESIINFPKKIKHTLFKKNNYIDIDQVKGHPTICLELAKRNNLKLEAFEEYVKNPTKIFNDMTLYYGEELEEHQKKWLFNLSIYGGSHKKWVEGLINPSDEDIEKGYKPIKLKNTKPRKFELQFIKECNLIKKLIWDNNPDIKKALEQDDKKGTEYLQKNEYKKMNTVISYFLQIIENDALYHAYKFLVKEGLIKYKKCCLEKDGLCFPPQKDYNEDELTEKLNTYIMDKMNFKITYKIKKYDDENIDFSLLENDEGDFKYIPELDYTPDIIDNKNHLGDIFTNEMYLNNDTIILNSCCGTGKTYSVAEYIQKNNDKVISVIPRISLANAQIQQFKAFHYDLQNYQDKETLDLNKSFVMCVNSLLKLMDKEQEYYEDKILYIDEISSFIENLTHSTILKDNIKIIHTVLMKMIKFCKKVIVSDHTIYNNTFDLLHKRTKPIFIKNTYQKFKDVKSNRYFDENEFMNKMNDDSNGFFACFDSATIAEKYYTFIKEKNEDCILITSQTETPIPDNLKEWENKRVFYSPRIEYGVDFNIDTKQNVYCHMNGNSILPSGSFQQITRTRNMNQLYLFCASKPHDPKYKDLESVMNEVNQTNTINKKYFKCCYHIDEDDELVFTENTFHKLFTFNEYIADCFNTDKATHLIHILKNNGFNHTDEQEEFKKMEKSIEENIIQQVEEDKDIKFNNWIDEKQPNKIYEDRAEFLNIIYKEEKNKFKDIILCQYELQNHLNTMRILKDKEYIESKEVQKIMNSYISFNINNNYTKINALFLYEEQGNINRFDFTKDYNEVVEIDNTLWEGIKKVYRITTKKPYNYQGFYKVYYSMINNLSPKLLTSKQITIRTKEKRNTIMIYTMNQEVLNKSVELDELQNPTRNHFNKTLIDTLNIPIKEPVYLLEDDE